MSNTPMIYRSQIPFKHWLIHVAATDAGLCYVQFSTGDCLDLIHWAEVHRPRHHLAHDEAATLPYNQQLIRYLEGDLTSFTLPLDLIGTPFQRSVWEALTPIPFGQTRSYSQIAEAINRPSAIRAVGTAIGANPVLIAIPCHRVIGKNGALTGYRGGLEAKTELLQLERKGTA